MDPYAVLEIKKDATADDIRTAYRKLAKIYHPDLNPGKKDTEIKFKEINAANAILSDPEQRAKFDRGEIDAEGAPRHSQRAQEPFYHQTQSQGGPFGGRYSSSFEGMDAELFESVFGGRRRTPRPDAPGEDQHYSLEVDFADSAVGAEREITLPTGRQLKVKIPAGIDSGQKLRFKGLGDPSAGKGPAGDAYVEITVRPSKLFTRNGRNLEMELPISLSEAVLGGEVTVPALGSAVLLKIPAGANSGMKLKVRGKGVGAIDATDRGDLIVRLKVVLPPKVDPQLQDAIREWSKTQTYNPRMEEAKGMNYEIDELGELAHLDVQLIAEWVRCEWIIPAEPGRRRFDDEDLARLRLIQNLREQFGVNDEAIPVILHLVDQLMHYHARLSGR